MHLITFELKSYAYLIKQKKAQPKNDYDEREMGPNSHCQPPTQ